MASAVRLQAVHRGRGGEGGGEGRHRVHIDDHQAGGVGVQGGDRGASAGGGLPNFSNPLATAHPGTGVRILFRQIRPAELRLSGRLHGLRPHSRPRAREEERYPRVEIAHGPDQGDLHAKIIGHVQ